MSTRSACQAITAVVIDDNEAQRELIRGSLESDADGKGPIEVHTYADAGEALVDLPLDGQVVVICDYKLSGASGIDWLSDFIRADVGPVIIVTAQGDEQTAAEAFRQGAADYLEKSDVYRSPRRLRNAITEALRRFKLERTNRDLARRLKLANVELRKKNEVLGELTDNAHRFVDDVAHEFRTPLAVIKEFASIMSDGIGGEITDKQGEYLSFISNASRDLAHLIDDFLDSGKLRARTLRVDRRDHAVADLIDASWPILASRAAPKKITLHREIAPDLPMVFADADKVRRTLINLIVNAIKFSSVEGTVVVSAVADEGGQVEIKVTDRGPGLPPDEAHRLFERFRQGSHRDAGNAKGFGLGLNIVRELVAINLGEVSVQSQLGEGSTFSFTLPTSDVECIVDAFLRRAADRSSMTMLTALRLQRTAPPATFDKMRSFVASVCHPTDIQLPGPDGCSTIVIGETIEPRAWRERLMQHDDRGRSFAPAESLGRLGVEHVGTWSVTEAREEILGLVLSPAEMKRCA